MEVDLRPFGIAPVAADVKSRDGYDATRGPDRLKPGPFVGLCNVGQAMIERGMKRSFAIGRSDAKLHGVQSALIGFSHEQPGSEISWHDVAAVFPMINGCGRVEFCQLGKRGVALEAVTHPEDHRSTQDQRQSSVLSNN